MGYEIEEERVSAPFAPCRFSYRKPTLRDRWRTRGWRQHVSFDEVDRICIGRVGRLSWWQRWVRKASRS